MKTLIRLLLKEQSDLGLHCLPRPIRLKTLEHYGVLCCISGLQVSVVGLERALHQYTLEPSEKPFDMKTVPLATKMYFLVFQDCKYL